jgi:hypothetical protein
MDSMLVKGRSRAWYLLPIFFNIIGGLIAYLVLRHDDPGKAKICLYLGITLTGVWIALTVVGELMLGLETGFVPVTYSI